MQRKSDDRPESRKDLIISPLLNETRLSYVCASHPHFEQTLTLSVQTVLLLMEKNKNMFFSIVIALLSSTTVCLCWFSDYTVCCCVGKRRAMASAYPQCSLFCSKVFWENINCMSNKGHRFNCPVWPSQPHPPTRTLYRACIHMHTQTWSVRWRRWNFQEY